MSLTYLVLSLAMASTLLGQTQIGGGTCNSSSLNGAYSFTLSGRQVASSGAFTGVLQANGTATFNGTNNVIMTMTATTIQSAGSTLTYSGTYSLQSNCVGTIAITSGDSATFSLLVYNQGKAFLMTGSDATYSFSGGGATQPANCSVSLLSGVYVFDVNGFTLSNGAINGALNAAGSMQLDGHSSLAVTLTRVAPGQSPVTVSLTGTYSLANGCSGSGMVKDSVGDTFTIGFTVSGGNATSTSAFDVVLGEAGAMVFTGTAHAAYGQPVAAGGLE